MYIPLLLLIDPHHIHKWFDHIFDAWMNCYGKDNYELTYDPAKRRKTFLKQHLVSRKKEALKKGWGEPPELLFYNEAGNRIDINGIRKRVFYKCLEKAGLRRIRIHDLRHTYATLRISKGDNILDVSKQLGHHSIKITLDTYAHWMPGGKKSEVDELDGHQAPGTDESIKNAEDANGE